MYQFEYFDEEKWKETQAQLNLKAELSRPLHLETDAVVSVAPLYWTEHCVECAYPDCYTTCDLYKARRDTGCRRFPYGFRKNRAFSGLYPYGAELVFGHWAHMWCIGTVVQAPRQLVRLAEIFHDVLFAVTDFLSKFLFPKSRKLLLRFFGIRYRLIDLLRRIPGLSHAVPDAFLIQVFNPHDETIPLNLTIRNHPAPPDSMHFIWAEKLKPGFNEFVIPMEDIAALVDLRQQIRMSFNILPFEMKQLIFVAADFVRYAPGKSPLHAPPALPETAAGSTGAKAEKAIKCLVFDLDNTLWLGTLIESDPPAVRLREGIEQVLQELDRRGILLSIASKNNEIPVMEQLRRLGIQDYFLFPQINWEPKSISLREIASALNIGIDTLAFVDDQPFEREEVRAACPEVMVLDVADLPDLLTHPRFKGSTSSEAAQRRQFYRTEETRIKQRKSHAGDYESFLRSCELSLDIYPPAPEEIERVHEMVQRTNQLNFSGNRYTREQLDRIIDDPLREKAVMRAQDRFGDYGIIGFAVLRQEGETVVLEDFAMSCRVQSKRVEHAFLIYELRRWHDIGLHRFVARYKKTDRNAPAGRVFEELHFTLDRVEEGNVHYYAHDLRNTLPQQDIVCVLSRFEEPVLAPDSSRNNS